MDQNSQLRSNGQEFQLKTMKEESQLGPNGQEFKPKPMNQNSRRISLGQEFQLGSFGQALQLSPSGQDFEISPIGEEFKINSTDPNYKFYQLDDFLKAKPIRQPDPTPAPNIWPGFHTELNCPGPISVLNPANQNSHISRVTKRKRADEQPMEY